MMPGDYRAITDDARYALAHARDLASRVVQARAIAAELAVTAEDLRSRARAECDRARRLAVTAVAADVLQADVACSARP